MKKYLIVIAVFLAMCAGLWFQYSKIKSLSDERDVYVRNTNALLKDVETYKTKQGLNVATVEGLELKLNEYSRYRAADAKLINGLQVKNRELQAVTTVQSQTINTLNGSVRDSVVYVNRIAVDTLHCIDVSQKWYEFHGCSNRKGEFSGTSITRDSLLIAETIQYKRFLGFLWKTSKIKNRKIDVISKNLGTVILGVEYVAIKE